MRKRKRELSDLQLDVISLTLMLKNGSRTNYRWIRTKSLFSSGYWGDQEDIRRGVK